MITGSTLLDRITSNPNTLGGKPCVRDTRISVELILSLLAEGMHTEELLREYPMLSEEDVRAAMAYAHALVADELVLKLNEVPMALPPLPGAAPTAYP